MPQEAALEKAKRQKKKKKKGSYSMNRKTKSLEKLNQQLYNKCVKEVALQPDNLRQKT